MITTFRAHYLNEKGLAEIESILTHYCKWFQEGRVPTKEMIYAWATPLEDELNANPDFDWAILEIRSFDHVMNRTSTYRIDKSCFEVRIEECET